MFADHNLHRRLEFGENLPAKVELPAGAQLRQVAAEEHEVGLRLQRVDVLHRPYRRPHEALIERALVKMGVGDVGDAERGAALHPGPAEILIRRGVGKVD